MRYRRTKADLNEEREEALRATVKRFKLLVHTPDMARFFFEAGWEALRKSVYNPNRNLK